VGGDQERHLECSKSLVSSSESGGHREGPQAPTMVPRPHSTPGLAASEVG
jgi:hypothetical protein